MTIKDKIKYIEKAGLGFRRSCYYGDCSGDLVACYNMLEKKLITENEFNKLKLLTQKTNFWRNYHYSDELNSQSILFINLVYNILTKK